MAEAIENELPQGLEQKLVPEKTKGSILDKSIAETAKNVEKKGVALANIFDGFCGDFVRTATAGYSLVAGSPLIFAGPIGAASLAILVATSYICSNLIYKTAMGSIKFSYSVFKNPLTKIKAVTSGLAFAVFNPLKTVQTIFSMPQKIYNVLFEGGNHNKYGKILGALAGGGLALESLMPNFLTGAVGGSRLETIAGGIGKGLSAVTDRTLDLITAAKEKITEYALESSIEGGYTDGFMAGLGKKFDAAFVYGQ